MTDGLILNDSDFTTKIVNATDDQIDTAHDSTGKIRGLIYAELYRRDLTDQQIADRYGVSQQTVNSRRLCAERYGTHAARYGLQRVTLTWPEEVATQLLDEAVSNGWTAKQLTDDYEKACREKLWCKLSRLGKDGDPIVEANKKAVWKLIVESVDDLSEITPEIIGVCLDDYEVSQTNSITSPARPTEGLFDDEKDDEPEDSQGAPGNVSGTSEVKSVEVVAKSQESADGGGDDYVDDIKNEVKRLVKELQAAIAKLPETVAKKTRVSVANKIDKSRKYKPPTREEVHNFGKDYPNVDPDEFYDYYDSRKWRTDKNKPIGCWKRRYTNTRGWNKPKSATDDCQSVEQVLADQDKTYAPIDLSKVGGAA